MIVSHKDDSNCNPKASEDKKLTEVKQDIPTLYVGESMNAVKSTGEH